MIRLGSDLREHVLCAVLRLTDLEIPPTYELQPQIEQARLRANIVTLA